MSKISTLITTLACLSVHPLLGVTVINEADLNNALYPASSPIDFGVATIPITSLPGLKPVNAKNGFEPANSVTIINGVVGGSTLDGNGNFRGLLIYGGRTTINNITFQNNNYIGGAGGLTGDKPQNGGAGGGGGAFGGALFVGENCEVTLNDCHFVNSSATGGAGGFFALGVTQGPGSGGGGAFGKGGVGNLGSAGGGGGGGSLYFDGGKGGLLGAGGGGGVNNAGNDGGTPNGGAGGPNLLGIGGGAGGTTASNAGGNGGQGQGGGGGTQDASNNSGLGGFGGPGGGGGGSGAGLNPQPGGSGIIFSGGGGGCGGPSPSSGAGNGGNGGYSGGGGGGGGTDTTAGANGGSGGFGGGGGGGGSGSTGGLGGSSSFGSGAGGSGSNLLPGLGGGGAGLGGAIFLDRSSTLIVNGSTSFTNCSATGGAAGGTGAGAGSGFGQEIFMMSSSAITFDINSNVDIPHGIQGDNGGGGGSTVLGGLTKLGTGRLTLNSTQSVGLLGSNSYTGTTNVNGGELRIFGVLNTPIVVNNGGTLSGSFNTQPGQGLIVNPGAIVSPGLGTNSVGTISISGDYHQFPGGILQTDITFNNQVNDKLEVLGNVTLDNGAVLEVYCGAGNYVAGSTYTVLSNSGSFTGTVTLVKTGPAANNVDLSVTYGSIILTVNNTVISNFQTVASGNPTAVNNAILSASIEPNSDFSYVVQVLGSLSSSALNNALVNISPVNYGALEWINERNNNTVADILAERLFQLSCGPVCAENSGWVDVFGSFADNKKPFNKYELGRFDSNAGGIVAGWDHCFGKAWHLGLGAGYTRSSLHWKQHGGHGFLNSYYGAIYSSWQNRHLAVDTSILAGGTDHHTDRKISFGSNVASIHRTASSQFWGQFVTARLGLKGHFKPNNWSYEPFALADYDYFYRNKIKEHGANSLNLDVEHKTQNFMRGEAGLKVYREFTSESGCYAPYLGVSWVGDFPLGKSHQEAHFTGQSPEMKVLSYNSSEQMGSPEAGIKYTRGSGFSLSAGYKGYYNSRVSVSNVEGRIEWEF